MDLSAIKSNIAAVRSLLPENTGIMAVVKADGYGHGLLAVARAALEAGAAYLAVADVYEGAQLRDNGITAPILVMGGMLPLLADNAVEHDLTQTVYSVDMVEALQGAAAKYGKAALIHIKIESGMNRLGVNPGDELQQVLDTVSRCPLVRVEGLFSHFAVSEIPDKSFTQKQYNVFQRAVDQCRAAGLRPIIHIGNSGAILDCPFTHLDMVRAGIVMYGLHPSGEPDPRLKPALEWKTNVVHIKTIEPGDTVSYGRIWQAHRETVVATLPVGYADGYRRLFGNRAEVLIRGKRAAVIGRVCMDHCMVDVTDLGDVSVGDEVVLLGRQGDEYISPEELAGHIGTINYEIITTIGERVKRVYTDG